MTISTVKSFCRSCAGHCGMEFDVENGKIVKARGDKDHPLTKGYFCVKGMASVDLHNGNGGDQRLKMSKKQLADGSFVDIEAELALDEIALRLRQIIATHGPESVAVWTGTTSYMGSGMLTTQSMLKSLMSEIGTPHLLSAMTLDQSAKWVTMLRMGAFATGKRFISQNLDVLMLIGTNPVISHQGTPLNSASGWNPGKALRDAKRNGTKLIVVDPRKTETARMADIHLQIIPGQDAALMAGLIKILLDNGWHDKDFCDRFVTHLDVLHRAVAEFDLQSVARRSGLPAELIDRTAQILRDARKVSIGSGTGHNMASNCNLSEHLTEALNAICAGYRRAGEHAAAGFININCAKEGVYPPTRAWEGDDPRFSSERAGRMMGEFPAALLPQAIFEGQIKALIVVGANPAVSISDPRRTRAALEHLDLLVTVDPRMTETSELSDYVIAPALPYEKPDIAALTESWGMVPIMQYTPAVLEMPEGVIEDWEFVWGLAKRLHVQLTLKMGPYGAEYGLIPGGLKVDMQNKPNVDDFFSWAYRDAPISYADLKRQACALSPNVAPVVIQPADDENTARLDLLPDDVRRELDDYRGNTPDAGYDYLLCSRRLLEIMNSSFRLNERIKARYKTNRLFMNPEDIAAAGLQDSQAVEIQSKHGKIPGLLAADATLRRGVVSMTHHWAAEEASRDGHTANLISIEPRELSTISYMPQQSAIPVNVRSLKGGLRASEQLV
jgi:anaerobic selenocysteine-containing dehydrogenase